MWVGTRCAPSLRVTEGKTTNGQKITCVATTIMGGYEGRYERGGWPNIIDHIAFQFSRLFRRDSYDLGKIVDVLCDNLPQRTKKEEFLCPFHETDEDGLYKSAVSSLITRIHTYNTRHIRKISQEKIDKLRKLCMGDVDPAGESFGSLCTLREREIEGTHASRWEWWVDVVEDKTQDGKPVRYVECGITTKLGRVLSKIRSLFGFGTANFPTLVDTFAKTLPNLEDLGQWYPSIEDLPNVYPYMDPITLAHDTNLRRETKQVQQEKYKEAMTFLIEKIRHYNKWHFKKISPDVINALRARVGLGQQMGCRIAFT